MFKYVLSLLFFSYSSLATANQIRVPSGTQIYLEPREIITSKRGENNVGEIVRAEVWRNVVVDGQVVIKSGSPATARVSEIKRRNIAGKKGQLKLQAVTARAVDGQEIRLDGGYHEEGKSRVALSVTLFLLVAWPLIFIPGKNAELGPGNVFDADIREDTWVDVGNQRPILKLESDDGASFVADVDYEGIDPEEKLKLLPLVLRQCGKAIESPRVISVNDNSIDPIDIKVLTLTSEGDDCQVASAELTFKKLIKEFQLGINRFIVESSGDRSEIIFQAEM
jgi:hypothetical protein